MSEGQKRKIIWIETAQILIFFLSLRNRGEHFSYWEHAMQLVIHFQWGVGFLWALGWSYLEKVNCTGSALPSILLTSVLWLWARAALQASKARPQIL